MNTAAQAPILEIQDAVHSYGSVLALDHVSLRVEPGEFVSILGESGSGKTTLLRLISGLEQAQSITRLAIGGQSVIGKPPAQRNCTTVFQSYALFPHMSVEENVAYGLKVRGVARAEALRQAREALAVVRLEAKAQRSIGQLSGGEKQRVALARAFVIRPALLLLDEPLAALDEKLRIDMQSELVEIQRSLGMTFIFITHSKEEALTMSDRVVLMRRGRVEQIGPPVALFDSPSSLFAAEFMGFENLLGGRVLDTRDGTALIELANGTRIRSRVGGDQPLQAGVDAGIAVRAEHLRLISAAGTNAPAGVNALPCEPSPAAYRGKYTERWADTPAGRLKLRNWEGKNVDVPSADTVIWEVEDSIAFPA
ncbi:ABC transporter ATP-binding protein [Halotalea alkalilenta]|uniref:ABC transporter ATP-binding protein n=1 Tax=Halotalea alkalilenta TaxID=376489 RepID=UPI000694F2C4|nr:ABC transporter ATP-binding protein [Halotalea alkalilenta]